ncbi:hypothetical protein ACWCXX_40725 [Streptomyces sp. NPDC001732]
MFRTGVLELGAVWLLVPAAGRKEFVVLLTIHVIEAAVTATPADGTVRTEQRRLLTSLLAPVAHPAAGLEGR